MVNFLLLALNFVFVTLENFFLPLIVHSSTAGNGYRHTTVSWRIPQNWSVLLFLPLYHTFFFSFLGLITLPSIAFSFSLALTLSLNQYRRFLLKHRFSRNLSRNSMLNYSTAKLNIFLNLAILLFLSYWLRRRLFYDLLNILIYSPIWIHDTSFGLWVVPRYHRQHWGLLISCTHASS